LEATKKLQQEAALAQCMLVKEWRPRPAADGKIIILLTYMGAKIHLDCTAKKL